MINVLIVDDLDLIRTGIRSRLAGATGIKVIGKAESGEEAIAKSRELNPDVVIMDIQMPGIGGLGATKRLLKYNPDIKVLVLTIFEDDPFPARLLRAGATGYITKDCSQEEMIRAVKSAYTGQRYLSPKIAQQMALRAVSNNNKSPLDSLSQRELQVMLMITSGRKAQDIAEMLCISPKTVNSYRYRIYEKLEVNNDVELTHFALKMGLVDMTDVQEMGEEDGEASE
ncbi:MAG: UvrY/SirA/GacA family response regulator transcription factor [Gammaproteobacteria bacterium]